MSSQAAVAPRHVKVGVRAPAKVAGRGTDDEWYIDDGQVFCRPYLFDQWLQALDRALGTFGATRGTMAHDNIKSSCRLLCPPSRRLEFAGWDTQYVHATTKVLDSDGAATALGVMFGPLTAT